MRCSILIVNWRTSELLRRLLLSLQSYPLDGEYEAIVVNNDAEYFDVDAFRAEFGEVRFLPQMENLGFAEGNNLAFRHSSGDTLILLNPDTEATEGALETLVQFVEDTPQVGIAAPQLVYPDGRVQDSCRSFPWPLAILWTAARLHKLFPRSHIFGQYRMTWFDHKHRQQVDQPMASCWAVPRKVIQRVGFLDKDFPILFNDVDFAWRVKEAGYQIWFVPEAKIVHVGAQSTGKAGPQMHIESHRGLVHFYDKDMRGRSNIFWLGKTISWINCWARVALARRNVRG
ncbi:MAG: glycosyltransferase family 2 protein [Armatimonadota bacterium]